MLPADVLQNLRESGLSDQSIAAMCIRAVASDECAEQLELARPPKNGGYAIPYFDLSGQPITFSRVRFLPALETKDGKTIRYAQRKGTNTHAYLPPFVGKGRWLDPTLPLIITEGEKKAAKAAQEGLVCVGLGGVDSWRCKSFEVEAESVEPHPSKPGVFRINKLSRRRDILSLKEKVAPELLEITLQGREVLICFDSDTTEKPRIQQAVFELACWLYTQDCRSVGQILLPQELP